MVNALEHNTSILYLPRMEWDRAEQVKALKEQFNANSATRSVANSPPQPIKSSFLHRKSSDQLGGKKERRVSISEQPPRTYVVKSMLRPSTGRQLSTLGEEQAGPSPNDAGTSSYDLLRTLDERWDAEIMRLDEFLRRNMDLVAGLAVPQIEEPPPPYINSNPNYNPVMITA